MDAKRDIEQTSTNNKLSKTDTPPAGPHAKDDLTDKSKTPGAGALPDNHDDSVEAGSG